MNYFTHECYLHMALFDAIPNPTKLFDYIELTAKIIERLASDYQFFPELLTPDLLRDLFKGKKGNIFQNLGAIGGLLSNDDQYKLPQHQWFPRFLKNLRIIFNCFKEVLNPNDLYQLLFPKSLNDDSMLPCMTALLSYDVINFSGMLQWIFNNEELTHQFAVALTYSYPLKLAAGGPLTPVIPCMIIKWNSVLHTKKHTKDVPQKCLMLLLDNISSSANQREFIPFLVQLSRNQTLLDAIDKKYKPQIFELIGTRKPSIQHTVWKPQKPHSPTEGPDGTETQQPARKLGV